MPKEDDFLGVESSKSFLKEVQERVAEAKKTQKPRSGKPRRKQPPSRVEPGWIHETLAEGLLRLLQKQFGVNVGAFPKSSFAPSDLDETQEPVQLAARVIAHAMHRLPLVSRIEKRLEGREAKAGPASDFVALLVQLGRRNQPLLEETISNVIDGVTSQVKRKQEAAHTNGIGQIQGADDLDVPYPIPSDLIPPSSEGRVGV